MLHVVSAEEAFELIQKNVTPLNNKEYVTLENALGRIVGEDIASPESLPMFSRSVMDGYAVRASDTYGSSESLPQMLPCTDEIKMGECEERTLEKEACMAIPTGGRLPFGADSVIPIENTDDTGDGYRLFFKPCAVNENIIRKGDDCKEGEIIAVKGTKITSRHIALLSAVGVDKALVYSKITVGIISTGDELILYNQKPTGSQIRDINTGMLSSEVQSLSLCVKCYPIVSDERDDLLLWVNKAVSECDTVLISGGSSAGERDNVYSVLSELGKVHFHGIAIKPGKPTLFATVNNKPVFGLPGHPGASFFIFRRFVKPCLEKLANTCYGEAKAWAELATNIPSNNGREQIIPVRLAGGTAIPVYAKSGAVSVLTKSDGYIIIDRNQEGLIKGAKAEVTLF